MDRRRLKILYVSRSYSTHDRRFLESFVRAGWQPTHMPMTAESLDSRPLPQGVTIRSSTHATMPATRADWIARARELRRVLSEMKPDVVIAGPVQSGALIAALAGSEPLVTISWGSDMLIDADSAELCRHATIRTLESSALVFGDCLAVREAVKRHGFADDSRIVTFPWGVDLDRFTPGPSSLDVMHRLGWLDAEVVISTRSWEPIYAIDVLLKAFARLHERRSAARLLLLGDGTLAGEIRALIGDLGIEHLVHMPGRIPQAELPDWFRLADVYVSSALSDGSSISLLEAMATGLPVVVTRCFGNLEWVGQGVNGALATPGDPAGLCDAIEMVLEDAGRAIRMSSTNIETAMAKANWYNNFPMLVQAVEQLVTE